MSFSLYDFILNCIAKNSRRLPWDFNSYHYSKLYPDVHISDMSARTHYRRIGKKQNRLWNIYQRHRGKTADPALSNIALIYDSQTPSQNNNLAPLVTALAKRHNIILFTCSDAASLASSLEDCSQVIAFPCMDNPALISRAIRNVLKASATIDFVLFDYPLSGKLVNYLKESEIASIFFAHAGNLHYAQDYIKQSSKTLYANQQLFSYIQYKMLWGYPDQPIVLPLAIPMRHALDDDQDAKNADTTDAKPLLQTGTPEKSIILGHGPLTYQSGIDLFIEIANYCIKELDQKNMHFQWVYPPDAPQNPTALPDFVNYLLQLNHLEEHISFKQASEISSAQYRQASLFLETSRFETSSEYGLSALANGLPVICSQYCAPLAGFLKELEFGEICTVQQHNIEQFARKAMQLCSMPSLLKILTDRIRSACNKQPSIDELAEMISQIGEKTRLAKQQEKQDIEFLLTGQPIDIPYWTGGQKTGPLNRNLAEDYIRNWKDGLYPVRPLAGFHPGIYGEHHDLGIERMDPLVHYIKHGKPEGPWSWPVIRETRPISDEALQQNVALQIHAFYPDQMPNIIERLNPNKIRPDLFISVKDESAKKQVTKYLQDYHAKTDIRIVPNCGRDIGPLMTEFGTELVEDYDIIGHIHTKYSAHVTDRAYLARWTEFLLSNLLGDGKTVAAADTILQTMVETPQSGLIFPDDRNAVSWAKNRKAGEALATRLGIAQLPNFLVFPVGTMFWARKAIIKKLVDLDLQWEDYPAEPLANDGTMLHAFERLLAMVATDKDSHFTTCLLFSALR